MKKAFLMALTAVMAVSLSACNDNNQTDNSAEIKALQDRIRDIEKENEKLKEITGDKGITTEEPEAPFNDEFLKNFCDILALEDPTEALKGYAADERLVEFFVDTMKRTKDRVPSCTFEGKVLYDHPFDIAEYKTDKGYLYVQAHNSKLFKIQRFIPLDFEYQLDLSMHDVETRDGEKLRTWVIYRKDGTPKKGSIFIRSPYMVYGGLFAQGAFATFFDKILVLQANRGSHHSTCQVMWLHLDDIDDSYDSLEWISKLSNSNGKVMAYGVSYDGYNALGSAASNHPALKSVIACSAPANAATDSFTASRFVENGIFSYVTTDRRNETVNDARDFWEFISTEASYRSRGKMDDILLGFDSEEWNITSEAVDDKNHAYWKERQLLDRLHEAKMPIAHVAGLVRDQDGRDTWLGFDSMDKNSTYMGQNYLALHQYGHGCGDFFSQVPLGRKLVNLTSDNVDVDLSTDKRVAVYSKAAKKMLFGDDINEVLKEKVTFELKEKTYLQDAIYQREKNPSLNSSEMEFVFDKKVFINGIPKMKIFVKAEAPEVPIHVHFSVHGTDEKQTRINGTLGWRTALITNKINEVEEFDLTFPLVNAEIPQGSVLKVSFSTANQRTFVRYPKSKIDFKVEEGVTPGVEIISNEEHKSTLSFQLEPEVDSEPEIVSN